MMFVPSKAQFPIKATPTPPENNYNQRCKGCNEYLSDWRAKKPVDPKYLGQYKLDENMVSTPCPKCLCWRYLDTRSILYQAIGQTVLPQLKATWQRLRTYLFANYPPHVALCLYNKFRQRRFELMNQYEWRRYFSTFEQFWLDKQIHKLTQNKDCVDNIRVATKGKSKQVKRYWKRAEEGCCGSMNVERFCFWNLKTYLIGCNYGH